MSATMSASPPVPSSSSSSSAPSSSSNTPSSDAPTTSSITPSTFTSSSSSPAPPHPHLHVATAAALTPTSVSSSSSNTTPTTVIFHSRDGTPTASPTLTSAPNSDYDTSTSLSVASLSKAELVAQLHIARMQAAHESEVRRQREADHKLQLEAELAQLTAALASKASIESRHAQVAAELASRQASYAALESEIRRLSELVDAERARRDASLAQQQMEVTALKVKLEAERLDQEHKARLLAARIAAVKMEIQDRKAKSRARKQADLARQAAWDDQRGEEQRVEAELVALRKQREAMETEQLQTQDRGALKPYTLDTLHPLTWPGSPANPWHEPEACIRHVLRVDADFNIIAQPDHRRVRIKQWPCGKGGMRLAYFCEDMTVASHPFRLVAKESIYQGAKANSLSNFYNDVRSQLVARTFAERFNALSPPKFIQFLLPMIYEFPLRSDPDRRYMAVELYLEGAYIKYSDNARYVNSQFRTIPAFCHWSWQSSGGQMMITDLQGVNYILTDPQIHSVLPSAEFGLGGGDEAAMVDFFKEHRCNEICHALGLKEHPAQPKGGGGEDDGTTRVGTQYASEIVGECGHLYILQVHQRAEFNANKGKMLCPNCKKDPKAVAFFPSERV